MSEGLVWLWGGVGLIQKSYVLVGKKRFFFIKYRFGLKLNLILNSLKNYRL